MQQPEEENMGRKEGAAALDQQEPHTYKLILSRLLHSLPWTGMVLLLPIWNCLSVPTWQMGSVSEEQPEDLSLIWGRINLVQCYKERLLDSRWNACNCNIYLLTSYLKPVVTWEKFTSLRPAVVKWNGLHVHHRHVNLCKASVMTWRFR